MQNEHETVFNFSLILLSFQSILLSASTVALVVVFKVFPLNSTFIVLDDEKWGMKQASSFCVRCWVAMAIKDWLVINRRINYCLTWHCTATKEKDYKQMHISFYCFRLYFALVDACLQVPFYITLDLKDFLCISVFAASLAALLLCLLICQVTLMLKQRVKDLWVAVLLLLLLWFSTMRAWVGFGLFFS